MQFYLRLKSHDDDWHNGYIGIIVRIRRRHDPRKGSRGVYVLVSGCFLVIDSDKSQRIIQILSRFRQGLDATNGLADQ